MGDLGDRAKLLYVRTEFWYGLFGQNLQLNISKIYGAKTYANVA